MDVMVGKVGVHVDEIRRNDQQSFQRGHVRLVGELSHFMGIKDAVELLDEDMKLFVWIVKCAGLVVREYFKL